MSKWNRIFRKASAWALAAVLAGSYADVGALAAFPAYAAAEAASKVAAEKEIILSFEELPAEIAEQEAAQGTEEREIRFPEMLAVTLAAGETGKKAAGNVSGAASDDDNATPDNASRKASARASVSNASSSDADGIYLDEDGELPDGEVSDNVNLEQEAELTGIRWRLKKEESSAETLSAGKPGDSFLYEPVIPAGYVLADDAVLPQILVVIEGEKTAAFELQKNIDGVTVTVTAEAGAFPADAVLVAEKVPAAKEAKAEAAVAEQREADRSVAVSYTFDIRIEDGSGRELEPADGKQVKVAFSMAEAADENLSAEIYHIKENAGLSAEKLASETDAAAETVTAETDGFSLYTVEFTYKSLTWAMSGGVEVPLSDILTAVGLNGEATAVEVSDSTLFSAEKKDGAWTVISHQAFSSEEWMKVTVSGIVYEIRVTDAVEAGTWAELKAALKNGGDVKLIKNVTAGDSDNFLHVPLGKEVVLDLNGKTIDRNLAEAAPEEFGYVILVAGTLRLTDSGTGGMITGGHNGIPSSESGAGGGVYVAGSGTFTMDGGRISGNKVVGKNSYGGGVFIAEGGEFTMNGGMISKNTAEGLHAHGGGVCIMENSVFTMTKGEIIGNTIRSTVEEDGGFHVFGGGVLSYGTFAMKGGTISTNVSEGTGWGGGVCVRKGEFTMSGGSITKNENYRGGGGVCIWGDEKTKFVLTEGIISENDAVLGGGVYCTGILVMSGGTISSNHGSDGGGVKSSGQFYMKGGTITKNEAAHGGGVFYDEKVEGPGVFNLEQGIISENTGKISGGGIRNYGTLNMSGGTIINNDSGLYEGGGIHNDGAIQMSGNVRISGNTNSGRDNNVYLGPSDKITLTGPLTGTASVGVNTWKTPGAEPVDIAEAADASWIDSSKFKADEKPYYVDKNTDTKLALYHKKASVTVSGITAADKVYDGTPKADLDLSAAVFNGKNEGDELTLASGVAGTFENADAGTGKTVQITGLKLGGEDAWKYDLASDTSTATADITPKEAGLIWTDTSFAYDGNTHVPTVSVDPADLIGSDSCSVTSVSGGQKDAGSWTAEADGLDNSNYKLPADPATAYTIGRKEISLIWTNTSLTYNGTAQAPAAEVDPADLVGSDSCSVTVTGAETDAGTWTATAAALSNPNYSLPAANTESFTISPAPITVTTPDAAKVYDGTPLTAAGSVSGLFGGETATFTTTGSQTKAGSSVNTYSLVWDGTAKSANYLMTGETLGTLTVTKKEVTVPSGITAKDKIFDNTTDATLDFSGAVISGKVDGDDVSVTATGTFDSKEVGKNRQVFISGLALKGADAGNYTLANAGSQTAATADIKADPKKDGGSDDSWSSDTPGHWNQYGNIWTYTFGDGSLARGWNYLVYHAKGDWYFFDQDGIMQDGWLSWNGSRYYLFPISDGWRGRMMTGWQLIDGTWHYFETVPGRNQGHMYRSESTPDGYIVDENGVWNR